MLHLALVAAHPQCNGFRLADSGSPALPSQLLCRLLLSSFRLLTLVLFFTLRVVGERREGIAFKAAAAA